MRSSQLLASLALVAGIISCQDVVPPPADPNHNGSIAISTTGGGGGTTVTTHQVTVGDNFFGPDTMTVLLSDSVTWVWTGNNPHTVTFTDGVSSALQTTGSFRRGFPAAGTYSYRSTAPRDSTMAGQINVVGSR
jgi:plastocyanin